MIYKCVLNVDCQLKFLRLRTFKKCPHMLRSDQRELVVGRGQTALALAGAWREQSLSREKVCYFNSLQSLGVITLGGWGVGLFEKC